MVNLDEYIWSDGSKYLDMHGSLTAISDRVVGERHLMKKERL